MSKISVYGKESRILESREVSWARYSTYFVQYYRDLLILRLDHCEQAVHARAYPSLSISFSHNLAFGTGILVSLPANEICYLGM